MLGRTVIYLITETPDTNEYKDPTVTKIEVKRFADELEVNQSEFYQANAANFKPVVKFKIRFAEYNGETQMKHNGNTYNIIRTYSKDREFIELTGDDINNDSKV